MNGRQNQRHPPWRRQSIVVEVAYIRGIEVLSLKLHSVKCILLRALKLYIRNRCNRVVLVIVILCDRCFWLSLQVQHMCH